MPNKKISQLVNKTTILSTDLFPIGDATSGQLYKKTIAELQAAIGGAVISVNGLVGTVVLDTDDIQELVSPTNKWFTDARARGAVSATSPLAYNSSTGVFFIPAATTSANGYLSSTDWTTFNNKQGALTLTVTGSSGASTLVGTTLNIPTYTLAGLGGISATFLSGGTGITYNSGTGVISTTITQYTDALARASLSFTAGSGAYNSTTGVITIPTNTSQLTNGANFITLGSLSGGTGITYNSVTGAISYSGTVYTDSSIRGLFSGSTGISYNSTTGAISSTITQYTDALARAAISLTTTGSSGASTYNSTTGVLNIPQYQGSITLTTTGTSGAATFSSNTLNIPNYGSALSGYLPLTGGTLTGALGGTSASFSSSVTASSFIVGEVNITSNQIYRNSASEFYVNYSGTGHTILGNATGNVSINAGTTPSYKLHVGGTLGVTGYAIFTNNITIRPASGYNAYFQNSGTTLRINYLNDALSANISASYRATDYSWQKGDGNEILKLDASGNLGLGVIPSALGTNDKAIEIGGSNSSTYTGLNVTSIGKNTYYDGTNWVYKQSSVHSTLYQQSYLGNHVWYLGGTGTAGSAISFTQAMTLDASGNLAIGSTSSAGYRLYVSGTTSSIYRTPSSTSGGQYLMDYGGNVASRSWRIISDAYNYGDFSIQESTTQTGTTYTDRLLISAAGNVLIGITTDSGYKLDINGTGRFSDTLNITSNNSTAYSVNILGRSVDNSSTINFYNYAASTRYGFIYNDSTGMQFGVNGSTRLTIASTGAATFSSSVTAGGNIAASGTGNIAVQAISSNNFPVFQLVDNRSGGNTWNFEGGRTLGNLALRDSNAGVERMTWTNTGSVGIGTTAPNFNNYGTTLSLLASSAYGGIEVYGSGSTNGGQIDFGSGTTRFVSISGEYESSTNGYLNIRTLLSGTMTTALRITSGGNTLLGTTTNNGERLYVSGNIRATGTITANSDIRLKKNLERIENALEKVGQISGYTYNTIYDDKRHGGVIAQEIDEVFPEIINKGNDGLLGVEYGNISALLIEALKELKEKNTALEARLQALEK